MKKVVIISWKSTIIMFCVFAVLVGGTIFINAKDCGNLIHVNQKGLSEQLKTYFEPGKPLEGSIEELYQDIFVTLLLPYIDKEVEDYYGTPYAVAPYLVNILSVERPNSYRTFGFIIKLEVLPYTGPHNTVGIDHITIRVRSGPKIDIEKFEHIKSFELPPRIQYLPAQ